MGGANIKIVGKNFDELAEKIKITLKNVDYEHDMIADYGLFWSGHIIIEVKNKQWTAYTRFQK